VHQQDAYPPNRGAIKTVHNDLAPLFKDNMSVAHRMPLLDSRDWWLCQASKDNCSLLWTWPL